MSQISPETEYEQKWEYLRHIEESRRKSVQLFFLLMGGVGSYLATVEWELNSASAKITVTVSQGLQAVDSPNWEEDTPNVLLRDASAVSHRLPTIGRNDRVRLPPLTLHEPDLRRPAGPHGTSHKLRWEIWKCREGLGSDDLKIDYRLMPAPK